MKKDLISTGDLSGDEIKDMFLLTDNVKKKPQNFSRALAGKTLALIFQKPSCRTRVSFEVGMYQMGGHTTYLGPDEINLGVRETISDVARTLSRYVDGIVLRTFAHANVLEMAKYASIPVINGLSDFSHPCQALADIYTIREKYKNFKNRLLAYIGDGNNVCNSLIFTCAKVGLNLHIATPKGYEPSLELLRLGRALAKKQGGQIQVFHSALDAARGADVLYTDVWASMGQESEALVRKKQFSAFQLNDCLLSVAKKDVSVMHCLPAHRGEEITASVMDSKHAIVFEQAENRLHIQKTILLKLLKKSKYGK
jgi:ornithine carbamoyltransferase